FGDGVVTTVWVGRDDFKSLGYREYGGKAALPIWIDYMRVALEGRPVAANEPPPGMVRVAVGPGGQLLPEGSGGISEWVKAEDVERMATYVEPDAAEQAAQEEAAFDIF
ncbi:MAG TPA: peptidase, partial [Luteimonas sp.]